MIAGLYDSNSKQARWILDDYLDNRYMTPPYGYPIAAFDRQWFNRGGFSIQPLLLAGLLPHLERDEPELFIWMFFNAWISCYREEIGAMVEHPMPELGYSNSAHFKTSDQANAIMWLRYMFVFPHKNTLHFGKAIPRDWFAKKQEIGLEKVVTRFGVVSVTYTPSSSLKRISGAVSLRFRKKRGRPKQILIRFRHPSKSRIKSVRVDGKPWKKFDPIKGDVDISGLSDDVRIVVDY